MHVEFINDKVTKTVKFSSSILANFDNIVSVPALFSLLTELQLMSKFSNESNLRFPVVQSSSFFTGIGGSTSSDNLSESRRSSTSSAMFSQISRTSVISQLSTQEESAYRNSIVMDSAELKPLSVGPPQRKRSRKSDYDRLEKIPESLAEKGKVFVFLPEEPLPEDDNVFHSPSAQGSNSPQLPSVVTVNVDAAKSLFLKQGSFSMYDDASSISYPRNTQNSSIDSHTTETATSSDHYSVPNEAPLELNTINGWSSPHKARPQSSIYTSIDDVDIELPIDRHPSPLQVPTAQALTLFPHLPGTSVSRPGSSIYTSIDNTPNSDLPERIPIAGERQSGIYTSIDETLPLQNSAKEQKPHEEYSYASSLMLQSPEKACNAGSKDGVFRFCPDDHHQYVYIEDKNPGNKKAEVNTSPQMQALVYQNIPVILSHDSEQPLQPQTLHLSRSMSTPDILLASTTYEEKSAVAGSPQMVLGSPQSHVSSHSSNSHNDLVSLQLQEELEEYSAYYNAAKIAGTGGWVVKEDKPGHEEQASNPNDDYHSDLSMWLTPEQKAFRSWSVGSSQGYSNKLQLPQAVPKQQASAEGNYTKIFAREVQRHIYERPFPMSLQSKTLGRPTRSPRKTPSSSGYVNQLVWLSSSKPVYPTFHKVCDSNSYYTHLLPPPELDDDGYTMPTNS